MLSWLFKHWLRGRAQAHKEWLFRELAQRFGVKRADFEANFAPLLEMVLSRF